MVCELPTSFKNAIERYKECFKTRRLVPFRTEGRRGKPRVIRERRSGGWGKYVQECEDAMQIEMKRLGSHKLGSGVHRAAYEFTGGQRGGEACVVKITRSDDPKIRKANQTEADVYRKLPTKVKELFIPVSHSDPDGWWLTQPMAGSPEGGGTYYPSPYETRVTRRTTGGETARTTGGGRAYTYTMVEPTPQQEAGGELENELAERGFECDDLHDANIGSYKGRNVVIDYGFGVRPITSSCKLITPKRKVPRPPPGQMRITPFIPSIQRRLTGFGGGR